MGVGIISKSPQDKVCPTDVKYMSMFTGIIEQTGILTEIIQTECGVRLVMTCKGWSEGVTPGESLCISGCCLTVIESKDDYGETALSFDVVDETLRCTTIGTLSSGDAVNVERSLKAGSLLGGHVVQGHVDGVETILDLMTGEVNENRMRVSMKTVDADAIVPKGSVTIEGVSLTIAQVGDGWFEVAIIPTTESVTTLGTLSKDDLVNIETDIVAKTIAHVVRRMN